MITDEILDQIVDYINEKVNIPLLNEQQERRLFKAVLGIILDYLVKKNS